MIKTLVFDLGGVIMDHDRTLIGPVLPQMPKPARSAYGRGEITTEEFLDALHAEMPERTKDEIAALWVSLHAGIPAERLLSLARWHAQRPCFLLSNNDDLHWRHVLELVPDFERYFDGIVLSHEVHLRKPEPEIYTLTEGMIRGWHEARGIGYDPAETLFVDDIVANTAAAVDAVGWRAVNRYEDIEKTLLTM